MYTLFAVIVYLVQLLGSGALLFSLYKLSILSRRYLLILALVMALLLIISAFFLFKRNRKGKVPFFRMFIAILLSLLMAAGGVAGTLVYTKIQKAMETNMGVTEVATRVGVYVLASDPATIINDVSLYQIGICTTYDVDNTQAAIEAIKDELGASSLKTTEYEHMNKMVAALYSGEVQAIIMNEAYSAILEDTEDEDEENPYVNFSDDTRVIYEYSSSSELQAEDTTPKDITKDFFVVYLSGSDTRSSTLDVSRSDVNILLCVNPTTRQILVLTTPRDSYVPISIADGQMDKLTHCGMYGIDCSMDTLGTLYDTDIDYYAQINFTGFEKLIDAIGGITINSDVAFTVKNKLTIVEGENHLDGAEALTYARARKQLANGERDRGKNQTKVVKAIINQITSNITSLDYSAILDSLSGMFFTNMQMDDLMKLVQMQINDGGSWNIISYAADGTPSLELTYTIPDYTRYVIKLDQSSVDQAKDLIQKVKNGETISEADAQS